jgi:hypothetical protein
MMQLKAEVSAGWLLKWNEISASTDDLRDPLTF